MRVVIRLTLEEAVRGITKEIRLKTLVTCPDCHGDGTTDPSSRKQCPQCHGQGVIIQQNGFFSVQRTCDRCNGEGVIITKPCAKCHGAGRINEARTVKINIPAGLDTGQYVVVPNMGQAGVHGGPSEATCLLRSRCCRTSCLDVMAMTSTAKFQSALLLLL